MKNKPTVNSPLMTNESSDGHHSYEGFSDSLHDYVHKFSTVRKAAFYLRGAIMGDGHLSRGGMDSPAPPMDRMSMFCRKILAFYFKAGVAKLTSIVLVFLVFVEQPIWCQENGCQYLFTRGSPAFGDDDDSGGNVDYYPSWRMAWLSPDESSIVERICVLVFVVQIFLLMGKYGFSMSLLLDKRTGVRNVRIVYMISVLLMTVGLLLEPVVGGYRPVAPYLRMIVFIVFSRSTQREISLIYRLLPDVSSTLFVLLILIVFYGWMGLTIFFSLEEGNLYFPSLIEGMWTLWIAVTTANYPDVMMPGYNENRFTAFYWISFMIIAFFFLMNVILSIVVNNYNEMFAQHTIERKKKIHDHLKKAFELLDESKTGSIGKKRVMAVFTILNDEFPEISYIEKEKAQLLFAVLDTDGSDDISEDEFMEFARVMLFEFERASTYQTFVQQYFPSVYSSNWFKDMKQFIVSDQSEFWIDVVLAINAIVIVIQSFPELSGKSVYYDERSSDGEINTPWEIAESIFTAIYVLEMLCKTVVLGWKKYIQDYRNVFDFTITILAVSATVYVYLPNGYYDSRLIRYVVIARVLRLIRPMMAFKPFRMIGKTCLEVLPPLKRIVLLLFCLMYTFAVLGMYLYGGKITRDPENNLSYSLDGTDFADAEYWANNFNDMMSGMNVLFNLLVVNNWTTQADAMVAVSGTKISRFYFLFFHVCSVIFVMNVFVASVIDAFFAQWTENIKHAKSAKSAVSDKQNETMRQVVFNASTISGTTTGVTGDYVANLKRRNSMEGHEAGSYSLMRNFFTKEELAG